MMLKTLLVILVIIVGLEGKEMPEDFTEVEQFYKEKGKELFVQELERYGYKKDFDFSKVECVLYKDLCSYTFECRNNSDIFYEPKGESFYTTFTVLIGELPVDNTFSSVVIGDPFWSGETVEPSSSVEITAPSSNMVTYYKEGFSKFQVYLDKNRPVPTYDEEKDGLQVWKIESQSKPYPGSQHFSKELAELDESLKTHKPVVEFNAMKFSLAEGIELFYDRYTSIEEVSDEIVHIYFDVTKEVGAGSNVRFHYNLRTGAVTEYKYRAPMPVLI